MSVLILHPVFPDKRDTSYVVTKYETEMVPYTDGIIQRKSRAKCRTKTYWIRNPEHTPTDNMCEYVWRMACFLFPPYVRREGGVDRGQTYDMILVALVW